MAHKKKNKAASEPFIHSPKGHQDTGSPFTGNILVLCLGNICRSPMAEGLLRSRFSEAVIVSAGLRGMTGWTADPFSVQVMNEHGIDISSHRAKNLTPEMIADADLILTMEKQQTQIVESRFPEARGKTIRLGEYGNYDIDDPYSKSINFFVETFRLIEEGIDALIKNRPQLNSR